MAFRQQQLTRADVLADRPDVLVRGNGGAQFGAAGVVIVDMLAHDHGVVPVGHRVAGVHDVVGARREPLATQSACREFLQPRRINACPAEVEIREILEPRQLFQPHVGHVCVVEIERRRVNGPVKFHHEAAVCGLEGSNLKRA